MASNKIVHLIDSPWEEKTECGRVVENLPAGSITTRRDLSNCSRCKVANYSIGCFGGDDLGEEPVYAY